MPWLQFINDDQLSMFLATTGKRDGEKHFKRQSLVHQMQKFGKIKDAGCPAQATKVTAFKQSKKANGSKFY